MKLGIALLHATPELPAGTTSIDDTTVDFLEHAKKNDPLLQPKKDYTIHNPLHPHALKYHSRKSWLSKGNYRSSNK